MPLNEFAHLINGVDAIQVAFALRHAPGEEAMTAKDQPFRSCGILHRSFDHEGQFESRTLPGNPDDSPIKLSIELFELALAIRTCCQRDRPVRMQVVHMQEGQECVQRSIDRGGNAVLPKRRERIVANHLVFELFPSVKLLQKIEPIEVQKSKTGLRN